LSEECREIYLGDEDNRSLERETMTKSEREIKSEMREAMMTESEREPRESVRVRDQEIESERLSLCGYSKMRVRICVAV
jgi:hypothetical protein